MKKLLASVLGSSIGWAASSLVRRRGCFVLVYHRVGANPQGFKNVSEDAFRAQMKWVREQCAPISVEQLRKSAVNASRSRPGVLVTFDDAYRDYHDVAYPILRQLGIPAVNFVSTHFTDTGNPFWWDVIDLAVDATTTTSVTIPWGNSQALTLNSAGRSRVRLEARRHIKSRPDVERESIVDALLEALRVRRDQLRCERQVMTWDEIRAVRDLTTLGGHTHTHPLLSRVDDERLDSEIRVCRERLQTELGSAPTVFAYPSGKFTSAAKHALRRYGFDVAFGTIPGIAHKHTDWLEVPRILRPVFGCAAPSPVPRIAILFVVGPQRL